MTQPLGADVEALDSLARRFDEESNMIKQAISTIGNQIQQTWWQGSDADRFRNEWESTDRSQLQRIAEALAQAAIDCRRQAQQQREVSGA